LQAVTTFMGAEKIPNLVRKKVKQDQRAKECTGCYETMYCVLRSARNLHGTDTKTCAKKFNEKEKRRMKRIGKEKRWIGRS
jgi:hypothetical protein